ncbi:chemotaxis protein CheX [Anaeromicropila herbilytica]|uniref:Chemotaxis protein CheX n=1 Tax=Anaeromicropila herbilytica TaxID=2785025 RepID=A0A7R7IB35_9FIRM|nr:chemotaxis protein CheX [Anaeromicropila herbilytica]BCN29148.1 chemotaxis protein CheX [Anaeromicropila herbilytica]
MAGMNAEHINPFLIAATKVLKDMCFIDVAIGKPYVKDTEFTNDTLVIMIGVTGEMRGQVMIAIENHVALDIASKMMMMPVTVMDELSTSAISELGNMILGNTATIFSTKGIGIDITPPTLAKGNVSFSNNYSKNLCIPLTYDGDKVIGFNVALKTE